MKIITWNCNMAFRKKAEHILKHQPDILIVPECEHPDKLSFPMHLPFVVCVDTNNGIRFFYLPQLHPLPKYKVRLFDKRSF